MRFQALRRACALLFVLLGMAGAASAQSIEIKSSSGGDRTGSISTSGSDCVTTTACIGFRIDGIPSFSIYLDVASSGTFVFEVSNDDASGYDSTTARWSSITEDVGGNATRTADGLYYFTNPGLRWFRVRASAISGAASVASARGLIGLKSTASISGGGDASASKQATGNASLSVIDDWDESDRAKVNLIPGVAGITAGAGDVAAGTPRMTLAGDDPAVAKLTSLLEELQGVLTVDFDSGALSSPAGQGNALSSAPDLMPLACESADIDGSAWPNHVLESLFVRPKCALPGQLLVTLVNEAGTIEAGTASNPFAVNGNVAHDGVDSGNPSLTGYRAIAHGTNPTAVAAADRTVGYANRAGVPFVIAGHPNIQRMTATVLAADGAQAGALLSADISAGTKIVVTAYDLSCSADNSVKPDFLLLFDADTTPPTLTTTGATGVIASTHDIIAAGGRVVGNGGGMLATGADGLDLRYHLGAPTSGACDVSVSFYTIES